jgi:hypothetical protein
LNDKPSVEQKAILQELAESYFKELYPYKGSKIHSVLGVIRNWTKDKEHWFYKAEATIVNEFGAEKSTVIEISVEPTGVDSGIVSIIEY